MSIKTKSIKKNKTSSDPSFVRITIDPKLQTAINAIQAEFPLLSTAEAVKLILSKGLSNNQISLKSILAKAKISNPVKMGLTEDEMFEEWEKFNQD